MDLHNIWMVELCESLSLAHKPLRERGLVAHRRRKDLDGDQPVEVPLSRFVDDSHSSLAEVFERLQLRKLQRKRSR